MHFGLGVLSTSAWAGVCVSEVKIAFIIARKEIM